MSPRLVVSMEISLSVSYVVPNLCSLFYFCEPLNIESHCMLGFVVQDRAEASKTMRAREDLCRAPETAAQREARFVERSEFYSHC